MPIFFQSTTLSVSISPLWKQIEYFRAVGRLGELWGLDTFLSPYLGAVHIRAGCLVPGDADTKGSPCGTEGGDDSAYIILQDATVDMQHPCVMDLKVPRPLCIWNLSGKINAHFISL